MLASKSAVDGNVNEAPIGPCDESLLVAVIVLVVAALSAVMLVVPTVVVVAGSLPCTITSTVIAAAAVLPCVSLLRLWSLSIHSNAVVSDSSMECGGGFSRSKDSISYTAPNSPSPNRPPKDNSVCICVSSEAVRSEQERKEIQHRIHTVLVGAKHRLGARKKKTQKKTYLGG